MRISNWSSDVCSSDLWITAAQRDAARAMPLGLTDSGNRAVAQVGGYYMEEVRRQLIAEFGETAEDGPHSVYAGGLWVRTPYDGAMQEAAAMALRKGLQRYDAGKGWSGPIATIEVDDQWQDRKSGRRSVRERVWQYVVKSVVAG